jgi:hypothetical protein
MRNNPGSRLLLLVSFTALLLQFKSQFSAKKPKIILLENGVFVFRFCLPFFEGQGA